MKKKLQSIVASVTLIAMLCSVLTGCQKNSRNEVPEQTTSVQTTSAETEPNMTQQLNSETTVPENTESTQETWDVEVLESTPDKITSEITNQKGETIKTSMGVEKSDETVPPEPDDAGNAPAQTQPRPTEPKATEPKPTEPKATEPKPTEPKATEPKPTEPKPVQPSGSVTKVEEPGSDVTFEDYESMTDEEQMLFYYTFADADAFNTWYAAAKAAYDAGQEEIIIGDDGVVNLG